MFSKYKLEVNGIKLRIEEIKKAIRLPQFFEDIQLQKSGDRYICPFHDDHTPSLTIKDEIWSCWACNNIGKDIIEFVKMHYKLDFIKSVEYLEGKYMLNGANNIDFTVPIKSKIKKNRKEITFFINKIEDDISELIKKSNIKFKIRDNIYKKLDRMFIKLEIINYDNDDEVFCFKDKLIDFENKVEELIK